MRVLAATVLILAAARPAGAEPLWEAGAGITGLYFPHYRGTAQGRGYVLPLPFLVYRGDIFKADRDGVRGVLFDSERVDLQLSVGAELPVDSENAPLRQGMASLNPSVEIGPLVEIRLWNSADRRAKVDLRMPWRAAVTVESRPQYIGMQFFPHLNVDFTDVLGLPGCNLGLLAGPLFADRRYNDYFYSVGMDDATATRPAYEAKGGYGGMQFVAGMSRRFPKFWAGAFLRYDSLRGASFESSPLVDSRRYLAGGVGLSWIFAQSDRPAPARR